MSTRESSTRGRSLTREAHARSLGGSDPDTPRRPSSVRRWWQFATEEPIESHVRAWATRRLARRYGFSEEGVGAILEATGSLFETWSWLSAAERPEDEATILEIVLREPFELWVKSLEAPQDLSSGDDAGPSAAALLSAPSSPRPRAHQNPPAPCRGCGLDAHKCALGPWSQCCRACDHREAR